MSPAVITSIPARPPVRKAGHPVWRYWINAGLFCAGALAVGAWMNRVLPFPPVPTVKDKLEWLEACGDVYDTLFIGTSRTNGHIVPELFDRLMVEAGMPTHSFNLGANGMRSPEDSYVLEAALARRKTPLKLVIVEANAVHLASRENGQGSQRAVYWRDSRRFWAICQALQHSSKPVSEKVEVFFYNWNRFLTQSLCVGRVRQALEPRLNPTVTDFGILGLRCDGSDWYGSILKPISDGEWVDFSRRLTKPLPPDRMDRASQAQLGYKRQLIERLGGEMMTFSPPLVGMHVFTPDPALNPGPYFNFSQPALYPEFYTRENRADTGHLNRDGAELFTRRLAEQVIRAKRGER